MSWEIQHSKLVVHSDGHKIELKSGTWAEPYDITPQFVKGTSALDSVRLIREGLAFAKAELHVSV